MPSDSEPSLDRRQVNELALANYIVRLPEHLRAYSGINPFWREITDVFRKDFIPAEDVAAALSRSDAILRKINSMPKTGYLTQPAPKPTCQKAWRQILADMDDPPPSDQAKPRHENAIMARFLSERGLLDDARSTLDALSIVPKYGALRHFFYFTQLRDMLMREFAERPSIDVLEIGAGGSTLKLCLKHEFKQRIRSYTIVDLPEMLCLSIKASIEFFPDETLQILNGSDEAPDPGCANIFVPAGRAAAIPREPRFDLFINTHSFQEMDPTIVASYFDLIYQTARSGALFFQTNLLGPMSHLDGSVFISNPSKYPFRNTDDVLLWQEDPFHAFARDVFDYKRTTTLTSIRRIKAHERPGSRRKLIKAARGSPIGKRFFKQLLRLITPPSGAPR